MPTPIICPLTSNTWGAASVLPRDVCNGLEDSTNMTWQYWDGKILENTDGKFHIYAGRWPQDKGFADWPQSVLVEGISNDTVIGSYIPSTSSPFTGKEQNVTGIVLNDGSFALMDSPGNIYRATSLDGPWTSQGVISITANGFPIATQTTENQTIWQSAQGSFLIISRNFQVMVSSENILGPYVIQTTIPDLQSEGYEDPVVWCSGGQYHLVANMYNARKAYHFTSPDGIHNWTNKGLAYDPTTDFVRYTDGTVNNWYKAERPGVFCKGATSSPSVWRSSTWTRRWISRTTTTEAKSSSYRSTECPSIATTQAPEARVALSSRTTAAASTQAITRAAAPTRAAGARTPPKRNRAPPTQALRPAPAGLPTRPSAWMPRPRVAPSSTLLCPTKSARLQRPTLRAEAQQGGGSQGGTDGAGGACSSDGGGVTPPSASSNAGGRRAERKRRWRERRVRGTRDGRSVCRVAGRRWRGVNTLSAGHTGLGGDGGEERGTFRRGALSREA